MGPDSLTDLPHAIERIVPMVDSLPGDIAIYHTGQSMLPNIPSGSLLHLRPLPHWQEFFGYGGVFVLELTDGRRITKQVMGSQLDIKTHVRCVSFNQLRRKGPAQESREALLRAQRENTYPLALQGDFRSTSEHPKGAVNFLHVWRVVHCLTWL